VKDDPMFDVAKPQKEFGLDHVGDNLQKIINGLDKRKKFKINTENYRGLMSSILTSEKNKNFNSFHNPDK
jgi:hypothetical protein